MYSIPYYYPLNISKNTGIEPRFVNPLRGVLKQPVSRRNNCSTASSNKYRSKNYLSDKNTAILIHITDIIDKSTI